MEIGDGRTYDCEIEEEGEDDDAPSAAVRPDDETAVELGGNHVGQVRNGNVEVG